MHSALLIAAIEAVGGAVLWATSRILAGVGRRVRTAPIIVRAPVWILVWALSIAALIAPLFVPFFLLPSPPATSTLVWLLICFMALVFLPYLWYSKNHPDWATEPLPDWARTEPSALFRAPWYGNWGGSIYAGAFVLAAVPFAAMGRHDATLLEALCIGVQCGILAAS